MLNINLSKFIHPNFKKTLPQGKWQIYPLEFIPCGLILETLRLPVNILEENRLFEAFNLQINETEFIEEEREYIYFLRLPLFILCLVKPDASSYVREFYKDLPRTSLFKIEKFILLYQQEIEETLEGPKSRPKILTDLQKFWARFIYVINQCSDIGVRRYIKSLGGIAPHLPQHFIEKLSLLALYSPHQDLISQLQKAFCPRLYLLSDYTPTPIPSHVFWELLKFIPQEKPLHANFILEFRRSLWELHLYTPPELKHLKIPSIREEYKDKEIFAQVLCFMLPNWAQVWCEIGWPFTNEIQKRLRFLKGKFWRPPIEEFVRIFSS
jgi:hypothetical protein